MSKKRKAKRGPKAPKNKNNHGIRLVSRKRIPTLKAISAAEFAGRFAHSIREHQQSYSWFLGAGCSVTSGIVDASGLVRKWITELHILAGKNEKDFKEWVKIAHPDYRELTPALSYAEVFERRHPSPVERQREIEMICAHGEPGYGYATLAQLLSHREYGRLCNTVLTTNFDDLIADALYLYGERYARPLVVTHEALARYVRTNSPRPTIVKLHGDAHLDPKNLQPETRQINNSVADQLYPFLQNHGLIFIGYGGNDESILRFVENCPVPALSPPIFWVSKREPPKPFAEWLATRGALRVDHTDFDQLMHLVRGAMDIELLDENRWNRIGEGYYSSYDKFNEKVEAIEEDSEDALALKTATETVSKSLPDDWNYHARARELEKSNPDEAENIFKEGLRLFPDSRVLNGSFGLFLDAVRKDPDGAERHFKKAIEADPKSAVQLGNYAIFLQRTRGDMDAAELFYKRAIDADATNANIKGNYASFLNRVRKDAQAADHFFKQSIESNPKDDTHLANYALFLQQQRNYDAAESYYRRAAEANPKNAINLTNYAVFLNRIRNDPENAEVYYKRVLEIDPKNLTNIRNYAMLLSEAHKNYDEAEKMLKRGLDIDPNDAPLLGSYAVHLETVRKDMDEAERFYKRAIEIDPSNGGILGNYADFLASERKDTDAAEKYYRLSIDAEPEGIVHLRNYANFLRDVRNRPDLARSYFDKVAKLEKLPKPISTIHTVVTQNV